MFADEIAPATEIVFKNSIAPTREEVLASVAVGCRRSLEQIYRHELESWTGPAADPVEVPCAFFLNRGRPGVPPTQAPGLPEVCDRCTKKLRRPLKDVATDAVYASLSKPKELISEHPQLSGREPRLVFVASGGVFRGAFHIGMLGAFTAAHAKPDLVVGASVGTLMGGALGKIWSSPDEDTLGELVRVFLNVDERVALTRRLKSVARELGVRGRGINLSPSKVRRMVVAGGRADAGFAATGAPPALIDAISDLLLIPHGATRKIAARFVGGDIAGAVRSLIYCLRTQSIVRLDIEQAVLDASLLESVAATLLSNGTAAGRISRQPFQARAGIAFYGTTTNLRTQSSMLLGGNGSSMYPGKPYDFVEAGLASSAFPAVFAPRAESLMFPGTGRPGVLLADGGMFDNLPFQPALTILSVAQRGYRMTAGKDETAAGIVARRINTPDLIIAGALDPEPPDDEESVGALDSLAAVRKRAGVLQNNVKIRSFQFAAGRVATQLQNLRDANPAWLATNRPHFVDSVVNAGVLSVFPHSENHLNGTFAFSASVGLKPERVAKSIADGCFQTLAGFLRNQAEARGEKPSLTARSVASLTNAGKIGAVREAASAEGTSPQRACPYFAVNGMRFVCPFAGDVAGRQDPEATRAVYRACLNDSHREEFKS